MIFGGIKGDIAESAQSTLGIIGFTRIRSPCQAQAIATFSAYSACWAGLSSDACPKLRRHLGRQLRPHDLQAQPTSIATNQNSLNLSLPHSIPVPPGIIEFANNLAFSGGNIPSDSRKRIQRIGLAMPLAGAGLDSPRTA